ncbi:heavy-metal-associated domain-containing protein [Olleya namhaensis]|uniref:heavy-metal-associated domain-containing protein n=1 Tax=Olleya namhaensis TaxID=1144750 RepID=UPI00249094A1|nr:MauE/DoxX family redox-associated membrane protein [Olleya namhaensis]
MTHTYNVTGMTCNGCKASVEKALQSIEHVTAVSVNLEQAEAQIDLSKPITIQQLQDGLPSKFTISKTEAAPNVLASVEVKNQWKQLFPLFLIFGYISAAAVLLNYKPWNTASFMLDFMGLFYIVFSFFKFLDLKGFSTSFKMYDPLAKTIPQYGLIYPFLELALGLLFLTRMQLPCALGATILILGITTIGVTKALLDKKAIQCACLGTALKLPMTKATFIENTIMLIMAVWMLIKMYN